MTHEGKYKDGPILKRCYRREGGDHLMHVFIEQKGINITDTNFADPYEYTTDWNVLYDTSYVIQTLYKDL